MKIAVIVSFWNYFCSRD